MRASLLPTRPSRSVLTIGMPPATAASKFRATPLRSASAASFTPCAASSALFAVTTDLPDASAVSTARLAGSAAPPISSTNTSMPGSRASAIGSFTQRIFLRSTPRFLALLRAVTATISIPRPQRSVSAARCSSIRRTTDAPTVPRPASPTFSGVAMRRPNGQMRRGSAPRREGDHVVQLFKAGIKKTADVARGLTDALLILHQRDAHVAFAVLAERNAGRHREVCFLDEELGEIEAPHFAEWLWQRRPREHRGRGRRDRPAGAAE